MTDKKIVICPAFRHLDPADLENWLEKMANKGWQIDKIGQWSSLLMTFRKGEPKKYRFVYDMQAFPRREYIETYKQFGWEYLGRMASAHMWRMEYTDSRPEAFSDQESLAKRNRRNIAAASVSFFLFLAATLTIGTILAFFPDTFAKADRTQFVIAEMLFVVFTLAMGAVLMVLKKHASN